MARNKDKKINNNEIIKVKIDALNHEGAGISKQFEKVLFVDQSLPGEIIECQLKKSKSNYDLGELVKIIKPSAYRTEPKCKYFNYCGGCNLQHLEFNAQVAIKQRILEDNLKHIGKVEAEQILSPIYGVMWGYRHRARLSVRYVEKKGGVLVGFHEKSSRYVADMSSCEILPKAVSNLIQPLRDMLSEVSIKDQIPQIEVAVGEYITVLVARILKPLNSHDEQLFKIFADNYKIQWFLQPKGPDSVYAFYPTAENAPQLSYILPEFNIEMTFRPTDFTQVNHQLNQTMMQRAMMLLKPQPHEKIADFFCGLGNFTLPIARSGATVIGIEGSKDLIQQAKKNAINNNLDKNTNFFVENLFEISPEKLINYGEFDKILIDPPRDGAAHLIKIMGELATTQNYKLPNKIVYVSCNPATLARDASILIHTQNYKLIKTSAMNMFPHTAHIESIAEFELIK